MTEREGKTRGKRREKEEKKKRDAENSIVRANNNFTKGRQLLMCPRKHRPFE